MKATRQYKVYHNSRTIGPPEYWGNVMHIIECVMGHTSLSAMGIKYCHLPWK